MPVASNITPISPNSGIGLAVWGKLFVESVVVAVFTGSVRAGSIRAGGGSTTKVIGATSPVGFTASTGFARLDVHYDLTIGLNVNDRFLS